MIVFATIHHENKNYFWVAVGASVFTGFATGLGEATIMGFLKSYPPGHVGDVSSGLGFAGLFATVTLLSLKAFGLSNQSIYLVAIPSVAIYQGAFYWLTRQS